MEIQVSKLREALKLLEPVVPKKTTLPIVGYVCLRDGKAMATNLETAVLLDLPEATEGMLLPARLALDFLELAPGHRMAKLTVDGKTVHVAIGDTEVQWVTKEVDDYPDIKAPEFPHMTIFNGDTFIKAMVDVSWCAASSDERVVLHAVCLASGGEGEVHLVGADGFKLGIQKIQGKLPGEKSLIIPLQAVSLLERFWKKASVPDLDGVETVAQLAMATRPIGLWWNDDKVQFRFGTVTMLVSLVKATYPNYSQLIPTGFTSTVTVWAEDMTRTVRQVSTIARDASGITRLEWAENKIRVSANAVEVGMIAINLPARCSSPGKIAFNSNYLIEFLSRLQGEITISSTSPSGPALFSHPRSTWVVMPMFVQWEGGKAKEVIPERAEPVEPTDETGDEPADTSNDEPTDGEFGDGLESVSSEVNETEKEVETETKPKRRRRKAVTA